MNKIKKVYYRLRYGKIKEVVQGTAGDNVIAEVEFRDSRGNSIGYWAYGSYDPKGCVQDYNENLFTYE